MTRALPSLLIGHARMPATRGRGAGTAMGKADLARQLATAPADPHHAEILLIRSVKLTEPPRADQLSSRLRTQLSSFRRKAARPVAGQVPPDVPAVRFDTLAELIACLLLLAERRSWWQDAAARILGPLHSSEHLLDRLCERAELLPSVMLYLDHSTSATQTLSQLFDGTGIARLAQAMARSWALTVRAPSAPARHDQPSQTTAQQFPETQVIALSDPERQTEALVRAARVVARPIAGKSPQRRAAEAGHLLAAAMGLRTPPQPDPATPITNPTDPERAINDRTDPPTGATPKQADTVNRQRSKPPAERQPNPPREASSPAGPAFPHENITALDSAPTRPTLHNENEAAPPTPATTTKTRDTTPTQGDTTPDPDRAPELKAPSLPQVRRIDTQFGGHFFLWHLLEALNLPETARDWNMPEALGPWGLIDALARGLLRPNKAERTDPVWTLLAELDGRTPEDLLGGAVTLPRPAPDRTVPSEASEPVLHHPPLSPHLSLWLSQSLPAIRIRLAEALACATSDAAAVLRRPAELHLAPAQLDVVFALDQADLPTRRAGLDIDPGWVPALGLVLRFHYV